MDPIDRGVVERPRFYTVCSSALLQSDKLSRIHDFTKNSPPSNQTIVTSSLRTAPSRYRQESLGRTTITTHSTHHDQLVPPHSPHTTNPTLWRKQEALITTRSRSSSKQTPRRRAAPRSLANHVLIGLSSWASKVVRDNLSSHDFRLDNIFLETRLTGH